MKLGAMGNLLVDFGDKRKVKEMARTAKDVQHWKCPKCKEQYLSAVYADMVHCRNGHKMKLVLEEKRKR